ncbi:MAG: CpsD/CapB family tyrosine-protein kinase, partial [Anaerolineales bacterium]|nr:CpsD/CapB family tyrosine-protein kinase [Anaerolineales bacterium]
IMAQGGKRVVLLDADLRRPRVHHFLNLPNRFGLSDVFREQLSLDAALQPWGEVSNLQVITSGSLPPNPAELLNSARMDQILADLQGLADVVIIDSPPVMVTDPSVLSARVDGVLVVIQPGRVNAASIKAMLEQFRRADARLLGIVLNRIPRQRSYYGGYRYYYAPYYYASHYYMDGEKRNGSRGSRPGGRGGLFGRLRPRPTPQPTPDEP